jgi:hypothetical protein
MTSRYDNYLDFGMPKAKTSSWMPTKPVTQFPVAGYTQPTDYSLGMPSSTSSLGLDGSKFASGLNQGLQPSMLDSFSSWLKNNMGTSDKPGLLPMGFGAAVNLGQLGLGLGALRQNKKEFNFNKDMAVKSYENQMALLNEQLGRRDAIELSNREGVRPGSADSAAYIQKRAEERGLRA